MTLSFGSVIFFVYLCTMKKLKQFSYWSQFGLDKGTQYYIMASSQKQVIALFDTLGKHFSASYVRDYFYQAWGNDGAEIMKDIEITEACIYAVKRTDSFGKAIEEPKKVV